MRHLILISLLLYSTPSLSQNLSKPPPEVKAVLTYMTEKEYPEVYKEKKLKVRFKGYEIVDIDQDGIREVFIWTTPYYHQSPTILIYQILDDGTVHRVREGLAPGPLVDFSGEFQHTHRTGTAADLRIPEGSLKEKEMLIQNYLRFGMHVVEYKQFFHTDTAQDDGGYVDMTHHERYTEEDRNNCGDFQFSGVHAIDSGRIGDTKRPFFIALTGDQIYIYGIERITGSGLFKKTTWAVKKPEDLVSFIKHMDGRIHYRTDKNEQKIFEVDFYQTVPLGLRKTSIE